VPIIPLLQGRAFGPEEIEVVSRAFQSPSGKFGFMTKGLQQQGVGA
jgi:hypothetical protein